MVVAHRPILPILFALLGLFNTAHATAVADLLDTASQSLSSAFHLFNVTVGGKLHTAVPFEKACFSILDGKHANVSATACTALQANYTNPVYRVDHFGAYMLVSSFPTYSDTAFFSPVLLISAAPMGNMSSLERDQRMRARFEQYQQPFSVRRRELPFGQRPAVLCECMHPMRPFS